MKKYLEQLLEKIAQAQKDVQEPIDPKLSHPDHPAMEYEGMEYMALWESDDCSSSKELFGIEVEELPPSEKLSEEQVTKLFDALILLLNEIGNEFSFPDNMPLNLKYDLLLKEWDKGFKNLKGGYGFFCHDFCTGNSDGCALGAYCPCLDN